MKSVFFLFLIFFFTGGYAQQLKVIKYPDLEKILNNPSDTLYIVNFWATWCKPCIEELPGFEKVTAANSGKNVKVILISLDFIDEKDIKVIPFLKRKKLQSKVVLLDEIDYNSWIDKVDPSWGGAIPVTVIFNNFRKTREFYEREFKGDELSEIVNAKLKF
jgi:thiol-disulfide isomerase/thioredoxin